MPECTGVTSGKRFISRFLEELMLPLPILPILGWTGGVAAGAQLVGGFVRGAGYLARGRLGAALHEVADGIVSPFRMAVHQVGKLGADVVDVFVSLATPSFPPLPPHLATPPSKRRRRGQQQMKPVLNGAPAVLPTS
jgi:hypothetical protein